MGLEDRVELNIDDALAGIGVIGEALTSATQSFKVGLADALNLLQSVVVGDVDASAVTTGIDQAVAAADTSPQITADAGDVTQSIDQAVAGADTSTTVTADASQVTTDIDQAVTSADTSVTVDAITAGVTEEINQAISEADTTVTVEADTSGASSSLDDLTSSAKGAESALGGAALGAAQVQAAGGLAKGEVAGLGGALSATVPEAALATAGIVTVAGVTHALFQAALDSDTAVARLNKTFGDMAPVIEGTHIDGFASNLTLLAQNAGQDDEALRLAAARIGDIGNSSGIAAPKVADTTQQILLLATRAAVLNPTLGQAGDVAERLTSALARGGRFAAQYGISLTASEIAARASADAGGKAATELTVYEKAAAGAALATEQLGSKLKSDIVEGAKGTEISIRAVKEEFKNAFEELGKPLLATVVESLHAGQPILLDVSKTFASLAVDIMPLVLAALKAIGPPVHEVSVLLQLLLAILHPVIDLLAAIPTPILSAGVAVLGLAKGLPLLNAGLGNLFTTMGQGGGAAGALSGALSAINPITVVAGVGLFALTKIVSDHAKERAAEKAAIESATKALSDNTKTVEQAVASSDQVGQLGKRLVEAGLSTTGLNEAIAGGGDSLRAYVQSLATAADKSGGLSKSQKELLLDTINVAGSFEAGAHATLSAAVASGALTRAQEVQAIRQHTTATGAVDWLQALNDLRPSLNETTNATDKYGNSLAQQTEATRLVADATQDAAQRLLQSLVATGQMTQAQLDASVALHITKDGATDYKATLDALDPALGDIATQSAALATGTDNVHTQFLIAKDAADRYKQAMTEIFDPTLNAEEANIRFHDSLQKVTDALNKSKGSLDLSTQAGRDADTALVGLVRSGESYIESLIAQGAPQEAVTKAKNDEIGALERLETQYPALKGQIDIYIATIKSIPATAGTELQLQGVDQFLRDLAAINAGLNAIPKDKVVNIPGIGGAPHMSGGVIWPGQMGTVAEQVGSVELVVAGSTSSAVVPPGRTRQLLDQSPIDYDRLAQAIATQVALLRPNDVKVFAVPDNPEATAFAVTSRLGVAAGR